MRLVFTVVVPLVREDMHAEVDAKADKKDSRDIAYPFLYRV